MRFFFLSSRVEICWHVGWELEEYIFGTSVLCFGEIVMYRSFLRVMIGVGRMVGLGKEIESGIMIYGMY